MRVSNRHLLIALLAFLFSGSAFGAVSCEYIDAVYTCTDGGGSSYPCSEVGGVQVCSDGSGGDSGSTCVTNNDTGQVACLGGGGSGPGGGGGGLNLGGGLGSILTPPSPAPSSGWLSKLTWWISYAITVFFRAIVGVLKDLVTYSIAAVLGLVVMAIQAVGVPSWLTQYSLGNVLGQTGAVVGFFMGQLQIPLGLALIGGGYVFRLVRKFVTLFQW